MELSKHTENKYTLGVAYEADKPNYTDDIIEIVFDFFLK